MKNWLHDEYIVLTGASSGIGRALAKILTQRYGAKVIGIGRTESKLQSLQTELSSAFSYEVFDVGDESAWLSFARSLQEKGISPRLLINNAGIFPPLGRCLQNGVVPVQAAMQTNFFSAVYAINALASLLKQEGKRKSGIVNICSSAALCAVVGSSAYTASKTALKGYTESLQLEERGKRYVGIFYPGTTASELFRGDEKVRESAMRKIAASPEKMAKKIAKKLYRQKKRAVLGWDAKCMHLLAKFFPVKGPALVCKVMKRSKSKAFDNVFAQAREEEKI